MKIEINEKRTLEDAIRILKKKLIKEGVFLELKERRFFKKPSEVKHRKNIETKRKLEQKKKKRENSVNRRRRKAQRGR